MDGGGDIFVTTPPHGVTTTTTTTTTTSTPGGLGFSDNGRLTNRMSPAPPILLKVGTAASAEAGVVSRELLINTPPRNPPPAVVDFPSAVYDPQTPLAPQVHALEQLISGLETEIKALSEANASLKVELADKNTEIESLHDQRRGSEALRNKAVSELEELKRRLKAENDAQIADLANQVSNIPGLRESISRQRSSLDTKDAEIVELTAKLQAALSELGTVKITLSKLREELDNKATSTDHALNKRIKELEQELEMLQTRHDKMLELKENELSDADKRLSQRDKDIIHLTAQLRRQDEDIETLKKKIQQEQEAASAALRKSRDAEDESARLGKKLRDSEDENESLLKKLRDVRSDNEALERKIRELEADNERTARRMKDTMDDLEKLKLQLSQLPSSEPQQQQQQPQPNAADIETLRLQLEGERENNARLILQIDTMTRELATRAASPSPVRVREVSSPILVPKVEVISQTGNSSLLQQELDRAILEKDALLREMAELKAAQDSEIESMRHELNALREQLLVHSQAPQRILVMGSRVKRGRDWKWDDQDGGLGGLGTVRAVDEALGWVSVNWDLTGTQDNYRWNNEGFFDVEEVEYGAESRLIELENKLRDIEGHLIAAEERARIAEAKVDEAQCALPELEKQLAAAQAVAHRASTRESSLEQLLDTRCGELRATAEHAAQLEIKLRSSEVREESLSRRLDGSLTELRRSHQISALTTTPVGRTTSPLRQRTTSGATTSPIRNSSGLPSRLPGTPDISRLHPWA